MARFLLIAALLLPTSIRADDWTARDSKIQAAIVALGVTDIALTQYGLALATGIERNPILGMRPTPAKLWTLGLSALAVHTAVAYALPSRWRAAWQAGGLAVEGVAVVGNAVIVVGSF